MNFVMSGVLSRTACHSSPSTVWTNGTGADGQIRGPDQAGPLGQAGATQPAGRETGYPDRSSSLARRQVATPTEGIRLREPDDVSTVIGAAFPSERSVVKFLRSPTTRPLPLGSFT